MRNLFLLSFFVLSNVAASWAQTNLAGLITDEKDQPLAGVTIVIRGTNTGTITQADGTFSLLTNESLPLTISVSFIGYKRQDVVVRGNNFRNITAKLTEEAILTDEVVVSASRVPEDIRKAAVTVEKLGVRQFQQLSEYLPVRGWPIRLPHRLG